MAITRSGDKPKTNERSFLMWGVTGNFFAYDGPAFDEMKGAFALGVEVGEMHYNKDFEHSYAHMLKLSLFRDEAQRVTGDFSLGYTGRVYVLDCFTLGAGLSYIRHDGFTGLHLDVPLMVLTYETDPHIYFVGGFGAVGGVGEFRRDDASYLGISLYFSVGGIGGGEKNRHRSPIKHDYSLSAPFERLFGGGEDRRRY